MMEQASTAAEIAFSEHARYKMQTRARDAAEVREAVRRALEDRSRMRLVPGSDDTYVIAADDLRVVIKLDGPRVLVVTVIQ
jgi:Domain of unknown function (DUF4258)